uniref:hydroxymethylglutaryl-CoA reductase (NADPH) n=1 Tax=Opuntia streptacantha TaxID=393608 RepID=A0A7C8YGS9_OPUST
MAILSLVIFRHNSHKNLYLIAIVFLCLVCLISLSSFPPYITISQPTKVGEETHLPEEPCSGRLIYIHDLPSKFNQDLLRDCKNLDKQVDYCPLLKNHGFGPVLNDTMDFTSGGSWYATNQFMLSVIFHNRMKQYECLTNDSSIASAIYAPFYPGLEMRRFMKGRFSYKVRDAMGRNFVEWLKGRPEWGVMLGWDHFFVSGRITWDLRRGTNPFGNWGTKLLELPVSKNMTVLAIESSPYGQNDFAIPYPTHFHPWSDSEVVEWQGRVRKEKRQYLFAFSGAPRRHASGIRGEIIRQCKHSSRCKSLGCVRNDLCNRPDNVIKMFMKSDFCLQPAGDSYTRRSTFDSILAGCIPVFFHPGSAYVQYLWHFPKNYTKYSVFIPMDAIKNRSATVEGVLSRIPEEDVIAMREEVIRLIPRIIYAQRKLEKFEDAFDITIKNVLERINRARRLIRDGKDPGNEFPEVLSWKYYLTGKLEMHDWDSFFKT